MREKISKGDTVEALASRFDDIKSGGVYTVASMSPCEGYARVEGGDTTNGFAVHNFKKIEPTTKKEKREFKVGDRVEVTGVMSSVDYIGQMGTIIDGDGYDEDVSRVRLDSGTKWNFYSNKIKLASNQTKTIKEEDKMSNSIQINNTVAKVFSDITTAELVTRYLGNEYEENKHRAYLDLKLNEKAVLAEAKRLQKEAEKEEAKSCS